MAMMRLFIVIKKKNHKINNLMNSQHKLFKDREIISN